METHLLHGVSSQVLVRSWGLPVGSLLTGVGEEEIKFTCKILIPWIIHRIKELLDKQLPFFFLCHFSIPAILGIFVRADNKSGEGCLFLLEIS